MLGHSCYLMHGGIYSALLNIVTWWMCYILPSLCHPVHYYDTLNAIIVVSCSRVTFSPNRNIDCIGYRGAIKITQLCWTYYRRHAASPRIHSIQVRAHYSSSIVNSDVIFVRVFACSSDDAWNCATEVNEIIIYIRSCFVYNWQADKSVIARVSWTLGAIVSHYIVSCNILGHGAHVLMPNQQTKKHLFERVCCSPVCFDRRRHDAFLNSYLLIEDYNCTTDCNWMSVLVWLGK